MNNNTRVYNYLLYTAKEKRRYLLLVKERVIEFKTRIHVFELCSGKKGLCVAGVRVVFIYHITTFVSNVI